MCQSWCLRRSHCARDQSRFCVCCSKTLAMYSSRRQRFVSPGSHGWPPDTIAQLHHTEHDCAYDRQHQPFTFNSGHDAPPSMLRSPYSHSLPSHGHSSFRSIRQNALHHHTDTNTSQDTTMHPTPHKVLENMLPTQPRPETQSTLPMPLPDFNYHDIVQELEAAHTISPRALAMHRTDPFPTTPVSQPSVPAVTSQSKPSSTKSSSYLSTPSLTWQTPDGSCSTPETSIDGAGADDNNGVIAFNPEAQRLQKFKPILPAPSKHDSRGDDAALETQLLHWPPISPHQGVGGGTSLHDNFLDPNYLTAPMSTVQLNQHHSIPNRLDWLGSQSINNHYEFIDVDKVFDFEFDNNGNRSSDGIMSNYPPLIDDRATALNPNASRGDLSTSQYEQNFYLPDFSLEMDDELFTANASRPYTDMFEIDNTIGPYQSIEARSAAEECGEGSRRDTTRDKDLLRLRRQGVSYREIKQNHGFTEAESTLRGRYRTLTKSKDKRVRKPIWKDRDVS